MFEGEVGMTRLGPVGTRHSGVALKCGEGRVKLLTLRTKASDFTLPASIFSYCASRAPPWCGPESMLMGRVRRLLLQVCCAQRTHLSLVGGLALTNNTKTPIIVTG